MESQNNTAFNMKASKLKTRGRDETHHNTSPE